MKTLLLVEVRKLRGSLALWLAIAAPALPGVLVMLSSFVANRSVHWQDIFSRFVFPLWALFLLPMVITAFTILLAQIEHKANAWDHLLALPIDKWRIFLAKAIVAYVVITAMTLLVAVFTWTGGALGGLVSGYPPSGLVPFEALGRSVLLLTAGASALIAIQLWAALRSTNFVVPLGIGIAGTLVALAVAMTGTDQANWFPWVLPSKILIARDPMPLAIIGLTGAALILIAMIADLSRRSFR